MLSHINCFLSSIKNKSITTHKYPDILAIVCITCVHIYDIVSYLLTHDTTTFKPQSQLEPETSYRLRSSRVVFFVPADCVLFPDVEGTVINFTPCPRAPSNRYPVVSSCVERARGLHDGSTINAYVRLTIVN